MRAENLLMNRHRRSHTSMVGKPQWCMLPNDRINDIRFGGIQVSSPLKNEIQTKDERHRYIRQECIMAPRQAKSSGLGNPP